MVVYIATSSIFDLLRFSTLSNSSRKAMQRSNNQVSPIKTKASEITVSVETEMSETLLGPG